MSERSERTPSRDPSVTVVLPTFRRPESLAAALRGLSRLDDPGLPWDLIVVDNDPPGAEPAFAAHGTSIPTRTRLVAEPKPGAAHARNRGIAESTGWVTAMIDDDVVPEPGWLRELVAPIVAGRADGTGGRVVLDPRVRRPRWFDEAGIGGYLASFAPAIEDHDIDGRGYLLTASMALRTDLLRETGGFDAALGPVGAAYLANEDVLLCRRFMARGGRLRYVPAAVVVHELPPDRLRMRHLLRRAYQQGRSDWLVDRDTLITRPLCGAGRAAAYLGHETRRRAGEGLTRPEVAFHELTDVARTAAAFVSAGRFMVERARGRR